MILLASFGVFVAAMAGLGIGMLVLGSILTLGFLGIIWIKRFDINLPYTRQTE